MALIVITMEISEVSPRRRTGRPLSFDREIALDRALLEFWRHGYETTSIADLTKAMGITAPSLYTAFGDKRRLFLEAMHRYVGDLAIIESRLAAAPTAFEGVQAMLLGAAISFTGDATPRGCLLASATASGSDAAVEVQSAVSEVRRGIAALLIERIGRDVLARILPASVDAVGLSDLVLAVVQGMSVLARDGVPRERLLAMAAHAMVAWPDSNSDQL